MKSSTNKLNQAIERMTTGFKINHAKDNAANYSISTNMTTKIGAYNVAEDNAAMGLDLISTAEGTLSQIEDKLQRLRALAEQASNGTYGEQSLNAINAEANALVDEINRLYSTAEYNGIKMFGHKATNQVGVTAANAMSHASVTENCFMLNPVSYTNAEVKDMVTMTEFINGTVSDTNEYSISTAEELELLATFVNAGNDTSGLTFVLGADIDLSLKNWIPIGNISSRFTGVIDGNGHIVKNLTIDSTSNQQGLFGATGSSSEIKNLGLESVNIKSEGGNVASLVGSSNTTIISNCFAKGVVTALGNVGGLVGQGTYTTIQNCYTDVLVTETGGRRAAGLIGKYINDDPIVNCYTLGNVVGTDFVGGICGSAEAATFGGAGMVVRLKNCYSTGNVSGANINSDVGGLIGYRDELEIVLADAINSYSMAVGNGTGSSLDKSDDWDGTQFVHNTTFSSNNESIIETNNDNVIITVEDEKLYLQIGVYANASSQIGVNTSFVLANVDDLRMIGLDLTIDYLTQIDDMLGLVSEKQTHFGATSNRLESVLEEITIQRDNLVSSRSTIRDADIAEVSSYYIQQQILQQASATLLATANQSPSIALQLI